MKKMFFLLFLCVCQLANVVAQHGAGNKGKVLLIVSNPAVSKQTGWPIGKWQSGLRPTLTKRETASYYIPTILGYLCEENFSKPVCTRSPNRDKAPELQNVYFCIMQKINLAEKFSLFNEHWNPKIVGELNGQQVKLVKFKGPFVWHHHENEDELFYVVKGSFDMEFRDRTETIHAGEFIIVPRGVEHRPNAAEEVEVLLFEPASTLNTGNVENEKTVKNLQHL